MHLGITGYHIRRVSVVGAGLAVIVFAIGYVAGRSHGTVSTAAQLGLLVVWAAAIGALLPAAIFVASVLRLEVVENQVQQTLFGRWVLARRSLADLVAISVGGRAFPLVLTFRDGSRMRVLGAPLGEVRSFAHYMQAQAPQAQLSA